MAQLMGDDDMFEKVLELGGSAAKKTGKKVASVASDVVKTTLESLTGISTGESSAEKGREQNYTPIDMNRLNEAYKAQDDAKIKEIMNRLQGAGGTPNGPEDASKTTAEEYTRFRQFRREEEEYFYKSKREKQEKEQEEMYLKMQEERRKQQEQQAPAETPRGKTRKNIFARQKKQSASLETKMVQGQN